MRIWNEKGLGLIDSSKRVKGSRPRGQRRSGSRGGATDTAGANGSPNGRDLKYSSGKRARKRHRIAAPNTRIDSNNRIDRIQHATFDFGALSGMWMCQFTRPGMPWGSKHPTRAGGSSRWDGPPGPSRRARHSGGSIDRSITWESRIHRHQSKSVTECCRKSCCTIVFTLSLVRCGFRFSFAFRIIGQIVRLALTHLLHQGSDSATYYTVSYYMFNPLHTFP